ncbi:hypothetical protein G7062_02595 [Erysipelothrix sp. HDW6C]|uniref:TfoX/Sxy family DNA transformation protein n=1 Tax=Erysipelothrix sp. HDW6C TaxID=2714930 RepID=UPI00140E2E1C|nr:TfoX/Sxy family DNA transformation protein [Erysipelothrix sp. HDW6C]QIK69243.1 hypothetical protein G7062_02595 [Erysipelothrix sp. HDW6C]
MNTKQLSALINIGPEIEQKLNTIGVSDVETFRSRGVHDVFIQLKQHFPNVCLVHLQVLQGAIEGIPFNQLSANTKAELKSFYDEMYR